MVAQLPHIRTDLTGAADTTGAAALPDLTELRAVGAALLTRLAELRERDLGVPDELWRAAERFQPLLDGIDPGPEEGEDLWELALALPRLLGPPPGALLVCDRVEHVEPRGA